MNKRKQRLSIEQKCKIITALEDGTKISSICALYGVNKSTISKIRNNKENIKEFVKNSVMPASKIKRISVARLPDIEKLLYQWFLNERLNHNIINDEMLRIKALEIHRELKSDTLFSASHGWIQKFKNRHSIRLLKICGEKLSSNDAAVPTFIESFKDNIKLLGLRPEQIYNADETGLIYKNLNSKTLVSNLEKVHRVGKPAKNGLP